MKENQPQFNKKILNIWRYNDGKTGHAKQSAALIVELKKFNRVKVTDFQTNSSETIRSLLFNHKKQFVNRDEIGPDIIIGAGHQTHIPVLLSKLRFGGKTLVIMKPSLPYFFFDFCLVPRHDSPPKRKNILVTGGPFTSVMEPTTQKDPFKGLFLIGGPNKHLSWSDNKVISQIFAIANQKVNREVKWTLSTSRRTPTSFLIKFKQSKFKGIKVVPFETTYSGWIEEELNKSKQAWVSQDSVSMIHEAIGFGSNVGILELHSKYNKQSFLSSKKINKFSQINDLPVKFFAEWMKNKDWDEKQLKTFLLKKAVHTKEIVSRISSEYHDFSHKFSS